MMDNREFQSRIKTLQGSITKNEPAADIIAQIETIKKDSRPNEDLLRVSLLLFSRRDLLRSAA